MLCAAWRFIVCGHEFSSAKRNFKEKSPFVQANYRSLRHEISCKILSKLLLKNHGNKERNSCILLALLFTILYTSFSFVSLEGYSSLITKGSFPYSSKYQEVPIACDPPVQNIWLTSGCCTVPAILQVKFSIKQLQQITGKMQTRIVKIQVKMIVKVSQENWTNGSTICFFQANILMYSEHQIYMYLPCDNLNWCFLVHFLFTFKK